MKKIPLWLLVTLLTFSSCKREGIRNTVKIGSVSLENAIVVRKGNIVFKSGSNPGGEVAIYQLPNGKYVLGLEKINFTSNINIQLHLSNKLTKSYQSEEIFAFRAVNGSLYNPVPAHIRIADFKYVLLQNTVYDEPIAIAELN